MTLSGGHLLELLGVRESDDVVDREIAAGAGLAANVAEETVGLDGLVQTLSGEGGLARIVVLVRVLHHVRGRHVAQLRGDVVDVRSKGQSELTGESVVTAQLSAQEFLHLGDTDAETRGLVGNFDGHVGWWVAAVAVAGGGWVDVVILQTAVRTEADRLAAREICISHSSVWNSSVYSSHLCIPRFVYSSIWGYYPLVIHMLYPGTRLPARGAARGGCTSRHLTPRVNSRTHVPTRPRTHAPTHPRTHA